MEYRANLIPTLNQMACGELEPTSKLFKSCVGMYRLAPWYGAAMIVTGLVFGAAGLSPMDVTHIVTQGVSTASLMGLFGAIFVTNTRKPSIEQIDRLAELVRLDPALASTVNGFGDREFTFKRVQRFIVEHAGKGNEECMHQALDRLEDAVTGRISRS